MSKKQTLARTAQSPPKKYSLKLGKIISFLLILPLIFTSASGFLSSPVLAANFNINGSDSSVKTVNTGQQLSISVNPDTSFSDAIIDLEIYDANGSKIFQQAFEHQNLNANQATNFQANWTPVSSGKYQVKVGIFNNNWSQNYYWQGSAGTIDLSGTTSPINNQTLTPVNANTTDYKAEYWNLNNTSDFYCPSDTPTLTRNDTNINFDWGAGSPDAKINNDHFVARWTKSQNFDSGNYTFTTISDDGVKLWVDGNLIIDKWNDHGPETDTANIQLSNGNHNIKMEYYENSGGAVAKMSFSKTDSGLPAPINSNSGGANYTIGADGRIYKNGQKIALHGVSWFGAEGGAHAPHGLWTRNWKEMVTQMKSVGFNAVRLPYCPGTLRNVDTNTIDYGLNPDLKGLKSLDVMDKIVNELNNQQMYIQLDDHNPDCNAQSDLWYTDSYPESQWIQDQAFLANRYKNLEYFIGLDIKNEPKGSATWGIGNAATDWNTAAEKAGKAALSANPNILIFVQGVENNPTCSDNSLGHWWGGNLEPEKCSPINPDYIPANKLDFTPHVYGPDVFNQGYFNTDNFPSNMPAIWDKSFGFLKDQNKAVTIGEYGGKFGHSGDPKDPTWQKAFMNYLSSKGICDNFYWSWNPNSGDTGGVLQDDWTNVWQDKVDLLRLYQNQCK